MEYIKSTWNELALNYTDDVKLTATLWAEIEKAYSDKKRHYHNLSHLKYMIEKALEYMDLLSDPDIVMFSIFYHDVVYKTIRQDNEQKSADIAKDRLSRLGVPGDKISRCISQIMATKKHSDNATNDTNYFVDFDLAILGDTSDNYMEYTKKIRKEYSIYPDFLYKKGRKKVLQHFLNMDRIFKTDAFYKKYEEQARANLKTELKGLSSSI